MDGNMKTKILIVLMLLCLSGCSTLSGPVYSTGLREQYIEQNSKLSTSEYSIYEIKDAPVLGFENWQFDRDTDLAKQDLVAQYKISSDGTINPIQLEPPSTHKSLILENDLKCIKCIKPMRYRQTSGYFALPLLIVTTPLDAAATIIAAPIAIIGVGAFAGTILAHCAATGTMNTCHE